MNKIFTNINFRNEDDKWYNLLKNQYDSYNFEGSIMPIHTYKILFYNCNLINTSFESSKDFHNS